MQLSPIYGDVPIATLESTIDDIRIPFLRQRRRLAGILDCLTDEQWATQSRCAEWTVQDVVAHLASTDQFWLASLQGGVAGTPTTFLADFDPKATPALLVDAVRSHSPAETLAAFHSACAVFLDAVEQLADDQWEMLAEAPPGHVPIRLVLHHALWDAWVHERDICVPLGLDPAEEPDELLACLRYASGVGPALAAMAGDARFGSMVVEATEPTARVVVDVGATVTIADHDEPRHGLVLSGGAVELIEALSIRGPMPCEVADEHRWLLSGLATVFEAG